MDRKDQLNWISPLKEKVVVFEEPRRVGQRAEEGGEEGQGLKEPRSGVRLLIKKKSRKTIFQ